MSTTLTKLFSSEIIYLTYYNFNDVKGLITGNGRNEIGYLFMKCYNHKCTACLLFPNLNMGKSNLAL